MWRFGYEKSGFHRNVLMLTLSGVESALSL